MEIDKAKLLERVIQDVKAEIERLQLGVAHAKHAKLEAPGRMQSRYDTMGIEMGWVADGLIKTLGEKVESLNKLSDFQLPPSFARIAIGALVGLGAESGAVEDLYFILPGGGGVVLTMPDTGIEVSIVTPQAPIAKAIYGKSLGDQVTLSPKSAPRNVTHVS